MKKKSGRPQSGSRPKVNWDEVDKLLVHGEASVDEQEGTSVRYPTYRDLAKRFKISTSLIARYAKKHNCIQRRDHALKHFEQVKDIRIAEYRGDRVALEIDDQIRIIDGCLWKFEEMAKEGRVQVSVADFNTLSRLKMFLQGNSDSRQEIMGGLTLDELQRRHRECMDERSRITPEMTGMVVERNEAGHDDHQEEEDQNEEEGDRPLPSKPTIH